MTGSHDTLMGFLQGLPAMEIKTDQDITHITVKQLRHNLGLSQKKFWGAVGVKQASASWYERGRNIPSAIRKLIFIRYVAGLAHDTGTRKGANELRKFVKLQKQGAGK